MHKKSASAAAEDRVLIYTAAVAQIRFIFKGGDNVTNVTKVTTARDGTD